MQPLAAIFDGGGVLTSSISRAFGDLERGLGLPPGCILRLLREPRGDGREPDFYELERGRLSEADFWLRLGQDLESLVELPLRLPDPVELRGRLWAGLRPNEAMIEAVGLIHRHYKTALLTNGVREWESLRALYPRVHFDVTVDSCEVGMRKPERQIYELACERLAVESPAAVFIDDLPTNVEAARELGMTGILFTTTGDVLGQLRLLFPSAFSSGGYREATRELSPSWPRA